MKRFFLLITATVILSSCEDEIVPTPPPPPPPPNYAPMTVGDWWAYQMVQINHHQNDTIYGSIDTLYVMADTIIAGESFKKLSGNRYSFASPTYIRDSVGYVIDQSGRIDYTYTNFTDTFSQSYVFGEFDQFLSIDADPTIVPAGSFSTINFGWKAFDFPNTFNCGQDTAYWDIRMAENVGIVEYSYYYSAPGPCNPNVRKLVDYYVQ